MHRLTSAMCCLILGTGLVLAYEEPAEEALKKLQGTWTATKAERDGKAADDVVGHRLSFTGNRFQIQSKDGKPLYAGTIRVDPNAKPVAIDFEHTEGALKGKAWKGIHALDGDTLTTCDNAPNLDKGRPAAFEAKSGSGYVLITFNRAKQSLPGGTSADMALAVTNPDEFAWQLFSGLCRQAAAGKAGEPDPAKPTIKVYDADKPVVWETWALASGGRVGPVYVRPNRSEVFKDQGAKPVAWDELPRRELPPKVFELYPGKGVEFLLKVGRAPGKFDPVEDGGKGGLEVRMNRAVFDYIRDNTLYNIEGLEDRFRSSKEINFLPAAQEIKAHWVPIREADKPRYHWRTVTKSDGTKQIWGLNGLHIITRDLPNWFWCDFEHVDSERNAEQYSVDSTTRGEKPPHGREGVRDEARGTKWETMRLRGTQTDFVDSRGRPTILANSQIEHGFQQTSSCITCHARATVGLRSRRPGLPGWQVNSLAANLPPRPVIIGPVGVPNPNWYEDDQGEVLYMQTHFLWSIPFRALSAKVDPPRP